MLHYSTIIREDLKISDFFFKIKLSISFLEEIYTNAYLISVPIGSSIQRDLIKQIKLKKSIEITKHTEWYNICLKILGVQFH